MPRGKYKKITQDDLKADIVLGITAGFALAELGKTPEEVMNFLDTSEAEE